MKQFLKYFIHLSSLLMIVSCGQSGREVKLEVSSSFIYSSSSQGGMVIHGVRAQGGRFVSTASGSSSINVSLLDGDWTFHAVAWDSLTAGDFFGGNVSCGKSSTTLNSSTSSISLQISPANCSDSDFTAGLNTFETNATGMKPLVLLACSSLTDASGVAYSSSTSNLNGFCFGPHTDQLYRPKSARVSIDNFQAGNITPGLSKCISSNANSIDVGRLPISKFPIRIVLFESSNCDGSGIPYNFPVSIKDGNKLDFDSIVNTSVSNPAVLANKNTLLLAFNHGKRGRSATLSLLPDFNCGTIANPLSCVPSPSFPSGIDFAFDMFGSNVIVDRNTNYYTCDTMGAVNNPPTSNDFTFESCYCSDGQTGTDVICRVRETNTSSPACNITNGCSVNIAGTAKKFKSLDNGTYQVHNFLHHNLPRQAGGQPLQDSLEAFIWDKDAFGVLSDARNILGFGGQAAAFSKFITETNIACSGISGERTAVAIDGFGFKSYKIIAKNSNKTIPNDFCGTSNSQCPDGIGNTKFSKRIITKELVNQQWITQDVLDFNCNSKVGHLEMIFDEEDNDEKLNEKTLMIWNTEDIENSLVEIYQYESREDESEDKVELEKKMIRIIRDEDLSNNPRITVESLQDYAKTYTDNNSNELKKQNLDHSNFVINGSNAYDIIHESLNINATFTNPNLNLHALSYAERLKHMTTTTAAYRSPYGSTLAGVTHFDADHLVDDNNITYSVTTWRDADSGNLQIRYAKNASFIEGQISPPSGWEFLLPRVSLNNDGNFVISYIKKETTGTTSYIYMQRYFPDLPASSLGGETSASFSASPTGLDVQMLDSDEFLVVYGDSANIKYKKASIQSNSLVIDSTAMEIYSLSGNAQNLIPDNLRLSIHNGNKFLVTWGQEILLVAAPYPGSSYTNGQLINVSGSIKKCNLTTCSLPSFQNISTSYSAPNWLTLNPINGLAYTLIDFNGASPFSTSSIGTISTISIPNTATRPEQVEVTSGAEKSFVAYSTNDQPGKKYILSMPSSSTSFSTPNGTYDIYQNINYVCADSSTFGATGGCSDKSRPTTKAFSKGLLPKIESLKNQVLDTVFTPSNQFSGIN